MALTFRKILDAGLSLLQFRFKDDTVMIIAVAIALALATLLIRAP